MTERRPQGITTGDWIERQIREAEARGEFADLPGAGKPLDLKPTSDYDYVAKVARREQLDSLAFLPASLRLAKEVEDLQDRVRREPTEARVRAVVEELNRQIREEIPKPQVGPPLRVRPVNVDAVVDAWRAEREARAAELAAAAPTPSFREEPKRRSLFRRRGPS